MATECDRGIVGIREEGILDDDTRTATCTQYPYEVLEEEESGLTCLDREILLYLRANLPSEWRICEDDVVPVFLIDVVDIVSEGIGMADIRSFDSMEDHIHRRDDIGKGLDLSPIEGLFLEDIIISGRSIWIFLHEIAECFTEESRRSTRTIIDRLSYLWIEDLYDRTDE